MVLGVTEKVLKDESIRSHIVDVVSPPGPFVNLLNRAVGWIVVERVKPGIQKVEHHIRFSAMQSRDDWINSGNFCGIVVVGLANEHYIAMSGTCARDRPVPKF